MAYALTFLWSHIAYSSSPEKVHVNNVPQTMSERFGLSPTRTQSGDFIPSDKLGSSEYCGHCHTQIFQQWNASAHHFSSFNNPVYRKVALEVAQEKGTDALKFCAGCHDPLPLLGGELDKLDLSSWSANAGITCLACHRITEVQSSGNGSYTVAEPTLHPFALTESKTLQKAHKVLLELTPQLHSMVLNKAFYSSSEYCASCHTLEIPKHINGANDLLLQNEYGEWRSSPYYKHNQPSADEDGKTCADCHMPLVQSEDPAAKNGMVKSHNFFGGNTLLPTFHRDTQHLEATEEFLSNEVVQLNFNGIRINSANNFIEISSAKAKAGDQIELALQVRNAGVGHNFPAGTTDSNEAWLEIVAIDADQHTFFLSGGVDKDNEVSSDSIRFGTTLVDHFGNPTDRRNSTSNAVAFKQKNLIASGSSKQVYYSFLIPEDADFPITISAKLNWRKYSPKFAQWVFEGRKIPDLPITVMSETEVTL